MTGDFFKSDGDKLHIKGEEWKVVLETSAGSFITDDAFKYIESLQSQLADKEIRESAYQTKVKVLGDAVQDLEEQLKKNQYVLGETRKALNHLRSEILPKSRDLESSYERRSYYAQLAGVAVDAINLTPDSLPPLYTEEQIDEFKQLLLHLVKFCELRVVHSDGFPVVQKISELTSTQQRPSQCGGWVGFHGKFYTEEEVRPLVNELSYDTCKQSYSTARCDS